MRRRTATNLITSRGVEETLPTAEEVTLRPELVKGVLAQMSEHVDEMDIEHLVAVGITPGGGIRLFHTYGKTLPMKKIATMLEDLAAQARKARNK